MSNCILSTRNNPYRVGDIFMSTNSDNPSIRFGGTWQLLTNELPIGHNVFGNGIGVSMTDGSNIRAVGTYGSGNVVGVNKLGQNVGTSFGGGDVGYLDNKLLGVPTKTQLDNGAYPYSYTGLEMDYITCYIWLKIA